MSQIVDQPTGTHSGNGGEILFAPPTRFALAARWFALIRDRSTVLSTVGTSFAVFGMWAVQGILLARILGPEGRGGYATAIYFTQTLLYIGTLGTLQSIARRAGTTSSKLPELVRAALGLGFRTGCLTIGIVALLTWVALPADRHHLIPLCLAASLLLPVEHMRLMVLAVDHGSANFFRYNLGQLVAAAAFPALLAFVWMTGTASTTVVVLLTLASSAFGLVFLLRLRSGSVIFGAAEPDRRTLIREGAPFAVSVVASNLFNRLDTLLVIWFASLTTQGYYAAALAAVNLLLVAPNALALFSFNWGVKQRDMPHLAMLVSRGAAVVLLQTITALAFAAALPTLMILVFGKDFRGAIALGMALLPAMAIAGLSQVAEGYLRGRNRAIVGVWARVFGAVVLVSSALLLKAGWGTFAIPIAATAGNAACAIFLGLSIVGDAWRRNPLEMSEKARAESPE
ncbi:MAG: oligosaccharide flippase family protein [Planctomycetaceae bacterium]|nr:oligosaccharide flippase family protein [Planctomycetaceae bacterium]